MISAPRKTQTQVAKNPKTPNPYAWRQSRQLWSLFAGIWLFSALILGAAMLLIHQQYNFFQEQAYMAFPSWVSYLEREEQVANMVGLAALLCWTPVLFYLCRRWTQQTFEPLIFFHQSLSTMTLSNQQPIKTPSTVVEFHEFYQSYQSFFEEMRKHRIKEAEFIRNTMKIEDMEFLKDQLQVYLQAKESEIGSNKIYVARSRRSPTIAPVSSPGAAVPLRRAS